MFYVNAHSIASLLILLQSTSKKKSILRIAIQTNKLVFNVLHSGENI
jgi:hypothetical protein